MPSSIHELTGHIRLNDAEPSVEHDQIGHRIYSQNPVSDQAKLAGRRGRANDRRVDERQPDTLDEYPERMLHRQHAARNGAVGQVGGRFAGGDRLAAKRGSAAGGKAGRGGPISDGEDARRALCGNRGSDEGWMHVRAVADDFGSDFFRLKNRAGQTGRAMVQRWHPVEEMRCVTSAGGNSSQRFVVGRTGVAERHAMTARGQPLDELETAVKFGRHGDDADIGSRALDLSEYF